MFKRVLITAGLVLLLAVVSSAQVPKYINYQGLLSDAAGNPLTGNYTLKFRIYSASSGGSLLWGPQTNTVSADAGIFSAELGPINYSVFDGSDRWLSLQVGSDAEMTPRKRLVSVGNSYRAYDADKLDGKDASAFVQKLDNVTPNSSGNIDLVAGSNVTITPDNTNNKITISASTGGGGDNLGNHTATQNVELDGNWLSGDGGNEGVFVKNDGKVGIGTSSPAKKLDVSGSIRASGSIVTTGSYIVAGAPSSSYGSGDVAATNDVLADDNIIAKNGFIRTGSPSTTFGPGDIASTDDIWADDQIVGMGGVEGRGGSKGVYGEGATYGVYGKKGGNFGWLGHSNYGASGVHSNGPYGYLGTTNYGAYGKSNNIGVYGEGNNRGVSGKSGNVGVYGTGGNWAVWSQGSSWATGSWQASDLKLKTDVQTLTGLLPKLMQLEAKTYRFKTDDAEYKYMNLPDNRQYGFIAQEVEKVFPELVTDAVQPAQIDENGNVTHPEMTIKSINYIGFIPLLLQAIQKQETRINALEQRVEQLSK